MQYGIDIQEITLKPRFHEIGTLTHLLIGFGKGKHYRDIPIHEICNRLGKDVCRALPLSQLLGIGKETAWDRWTCILQACYFWKQPLLPMQVIPEYAS